MGEKILLLFRYKSKFRRLIVIVVKKIEECNERK